MIRRLFVVLAGGAAITLEAAPHAVAQQPYENCSAAARDGQYNIHPTARITGRGLIKDKDGVGVREVISDRAERRHHRFRRAALLVTLVAGYAATDLPAPVASAEIPPYQIWYGLSWYGPACVPVSLDGQRKLVCDKFSDATGPRDSHQYTEVVMPGTRSVTVYSLNDAKWVNCTTWQGDYVTDDQDDEGTGFALCTFAAT